MLDMKTTPVWDCPCHGSRFSAKGKVISGPAEKPMEFIPAAGAGDEQADTSSLAMVGDR